MTAVTESTRVLVLRSGAVLIHGLTVGRRSWTIARVDL